MFRHLWLVVGLGAAAFPHMAIADMYTLNCLIGYENDRHDKLCAVVAPELGGAVVEAQRKWRERNRESLVALKAACGVRLRKAYGDDTARLNGDRERVIAIRNEDDLALFLLKAS